jgi:pyridinium-3,5-biscarboxylic acid mononucleotide sulfurtransferase
LRAEGVVGDLRVRHFGDLARVELSSMELARWVDADSRARLEAVVRAAGYQRVELDPRGFRSGSLNEQASQRATLSRD